MKTLLLSTAMGLLTVVLAVFSVPTSAFEFRCDVLDPGTLQPKSTFRPGDEVLFIVKGDISPEEAKEEMTVETTLIARVLGFAFTKRLSGLTIVPDFATRQTINGFQDIEDEFADGFSFEGSEVIKLLENMPLSSINVKITATIANVGTQECRQSIRILDQ